jgi:hypothetical protein
MDDHATIKWMADIPFPFGWYPFLPGTSWPVLHEYDLLPPIPPPDPAFRFLAPDSDSDTTTPTPAREAHRVRLRRRLATLTGATARLGLTFPEGFTRFMGSPDLQARIRREAARAGCRIRWCRAPASTAAIWCAS